MSTVIISKKPPLKKAFLQMMFGSPLPQDWLDKYFDNCEKLAGYGWEWKIFTPDADSIKGRKNVHLVKMSLEEFDDRVALKTGIHPHNYIEDHGNYSAPHKLTSDYYPAYGLILDDYIKDADYWGHTNWDIVYGRLDHFYPDELIKEYDIVADEADEINGPFTLYKNSDFVNNFFREVPGWQNVFEDHTLFYFDEKAEFMTGAVRRGRDEGRLKFYTPPNYPHHGYDRFEHHKPIPQLEWQKDGSLYEIFKDFVTGRRMGREIAFYHFSYTKKYPDIAVR